MSLHVDRTATFSLAAPPAEAFELFTPEGERRWIADWSPQYFHPADGTLAAGLTFRTSRAGETVDWLVTRYEPARFAVEYCRITAGARFGTVGVVCREAGAGTHVEVRYRLTATSDDGRTALTRFAAGFDDMTVAWAGQLAAALRGSR
jgi:hypothetical protein